MAWSGFWGAAAGGGGGTDPADKARISALENAVYEYEIFEVIGGGASGSVTIPTGASIILDQYPGAGDCLVTELDPTTARPIDEPALTAGGQPVTATLSGAGAWALSGTPAAYPVGLIFQIQLSELNRASLDQSRLVNETKLGMNLFVQNADPGMTVPGLWVQTGLGVGGTDMTFWVEDGL